MNKTKAATQWLTAVHNYFFNIKIADLRYEYWFIIKCCIQCSYAVAIDDAIACARALVVNSNSNNYPVYSSDCTNFASQILENGGISQDYNYSTNQGMV